MAGNEEPNQSDFPQKKKCRCDWSQRIDETSATNLKKNTRRVCVACSVIARFDKINKIIFLKIQYL
jgi:gluconate kinase